MLKTNKKPEKKKKINWKSIFKWSLLGLSIGMLMATGVNAGITKVYSDKIVADGNMHERPIGIVDDQSTLDSVANSAGGMFYYNLNGVKTLFVPESEDMKNNLSPDSLFLARKSSSGISLINNENAVETKDFESDYLKFSLNSSDSLDKFVFYNGTTGHYSPLLSVSNQFINPFREIDGTSYKLKTNNSKEIEKMTITFKKEIPEFWKAGFTSWFSFDFTKNGNSLTKNSPISDTDATIKLVDNKTLSIDFNNLKVSEDDLAEQGNDNTKIGVWFIVYSKIEMEEQVEGSSYSPIGIQFTKAN